MVLLQNCRLIQHGAASAAWNMTVDEALMQCAAEIPVLRLYQWSEPAISLGYFQSWQVAPAGRPFVRRYTGGGLVDHAHDVTYSIAAPRHSTLGQLSTAESYALIHQGIAAALTAIGLSVVITPCCVESEEPGCFAKPVKYDLLLNGQKVAGAAQRRTRQRFLQQGSILLPDATLNQAVRDKLPSALADMLGWEYQESDLIPEEIKIADELESSRYSSKEWNMER
jgi:lipoyl(octanoyl) transferase